MESGLCHIYSMDYFKVININQLDLLCTNMDRPVICLNKVSISQVTEGDRQNKKQNIKHEKKDCIVTLR